MVKVVRFNASVEEGFLYVYVGRPTSYYLCNPKMCAVDGSILGNPAFMANESARNAVCDHYEKEVFPVVRKHPVAGPLLADLKERHDRGMKIA